MGDLCASVRALWVAVTATLRAIPEGNADTAAQPLLKGPLSAKVPIPLHGGGSGVGKGPRNPNDKLQIGWTVFGRDRMNMGLDAYPPTLAQVTKKGTYSWHSWNKGLARRSFCTFFALRPRSDHRLRATGVWKKTARQSCPTRRCLVWVSLPHCQCR